ncbi:MAG: hypothetical protein ACI3W9_05170 [Eubacteriales bacterium]
MENNLMKRKSYSKPCVEFVNFSLSGSIAAVCKYVGTNTDGNTCGYRYNGWIMFAVDGICDVIKKDSTFCYHVPTEDTSVFSS